MDGETFDVAVVGAGITGLTAAFHAARRGLRVAVLEAGEAGAGASGRNSGFVIPTLSRVGPDDVARAWGDARAARFNAQLSGAATALFEFIRAEGIVCDARQNGWLQPDRLEPSDGVWQHRLRTQRQAGADARLVERDELHALCGTARYPAALCLTEGGQIDPLAFTRGLAAAFTRLGGTVLNGCRLLAPAAEQTKVLVGLDTSLGMVFARRVIMATNANGHDGARNLTAATLPFALVLAAYDLPVCGADHVLRTHQPFSDVGRDMAFFRRLQGNRLLTGMFPTSTRLSREAIDAELQRRIGHVFGVETTGLTDLWAGRVGVTPRGLPQLLQFGPNVFGWTGCNGRGIALSFVMGHWLADLVADAPIESIPVPLQALKAARAPQLGVWFARRLIAAERRRRERHERRGATPACTVLHYPLD
ncbi:FAD-binding oxidoreductase [Paraburkholderia sp. MMS20-SJTR3]|uniref:FAD-binding oxidoreductase n=1 Tax=Paraburkholderia sejongensis TaxID=2886946 RepID=A0ABS8K597_9BURK|nr:FAD-binding oxidoreductase [Paraburkholderia sp. MMS20-SJTR3]MCC8397337.1 FAD-binding oxidoreductase [Paraburkholderia sp. MMS20-SJTR3]